MHGHPRMNFLDPQTFAASTVADSEGLAAALRSLDSYLAGSDECLDMIIQDLCSIPNLFEFIISAWPGGRKLASRVIDAYPTDPALIGASYTSTVLQRLSSVIFSLPPDLFPILTVLQIEEYKTYVENALSALTLLYRSTEFLTGVPTNTTPATHPEHGNGSRSSTHQKKTKSKSKDRDSVPNINTTAFKKLGTKVPSNYAEASEMACEISNGLKMILKFCFEVLFEPFVAPQLKDTYILAISDANVDPTVPPEVEDIEVVESKPSAYPEVQPLKVALNFKNADGFGEWRIIIGTNATKKLQELARCDRKKCATIVKKIRQLSKGHFFDENQKRLNDPPGVPIFEAKIQEDLRLVYQVDVIPDYDGNVERQVIRIYGIRTHTQLNRIWNAMGRHLAGKSMEYNRRCVFRNQPIRPSGDVYLPACFPLEDVENNIKSVSHVCVDEVIGELHALLVLDKYITFSQGFLHGLIANEDAQHFFELKPQERRIVECETSCYVLGRSGTGKTTTMLFKMLGIERAWQMRTSGRDVPKPRQIFVTKSNILAERVEEYFTKLLKSLALARCSLKDLKSRSIDLSGPRVHIPTKYSLLEENHFPLFVTFDQLARMIAADVLSSDNLGVQHDANILISTSEIEDEDLFVTYDIFARTYWPHFPRPLLKGLEPWLVFAEFMGVIKGSEESLKCPGGFLDENTYCRLSARSNPTFANHRQTLYALFRAYCKLKKERQHHDVADRTYAILKALPGCTSLGGVDFLYVDEAQDNLLIDSLLLRHICPNPKGLFWAGDTAQTISAGSSFRFDDLKAFLYRIERDPSVHLIRDCSVADPSVFQLAINYRSHSGIVNCAQTIIERITHFWPDAIDRLKPEHGVVDGPKPVFLRGWDQDAVHHEQLLFGESENRIEFGAEQCIIVRDKRALEKLRQDIGRKVGLIMTLYDSKGLEFNDVLLYNFFEDSPIDLSRWSVLLNDVAGKADGKDLAKVYAPSFGRDEGHFAGVCSELKMLYVAITRARRTLWIFDKSEKSEPMRMIWTSRSQIWNCTPAIGIPHFAVSSTDTEWEKFGHRLLKNEKYLDAMDCFTRVSLPRMAAICEAFHRRELARGKVGVDSQKAKQDAFLDAANALLAATDAFAMGGRDAPSEKDKLQFYRNAAECYIRGGDHRQASIVYLSAEEYDLGARCLWKGELFDEALEFRHEHSQKITSHCSEELLTKCRLFYCKRDHSKRPRLPLFSSLEEEEKFLKDYDIDSSRAELLEFYGRYSEAAKLHLSENRPVNAIKDLLKDHSRIAIQKATEILLDSLWHQCSFPISPKDVATNQHVAQLLNLACELPDTVVDPLDRREISMFQAIVQADLAGIDKLALEFINRNQNAPALLALDYFLSHFPDLKSYSVHEVSGFLTKFVNYTRLLCSVISYTDPLSIDWIRRLFCVKAEPNTNLYSLGIRSFLRRSTTVNRGGHLHSSNSVMAFSKRDVVSALHKHLREYLRERVLKENKLCHRAPVFSHCVANPCNCANCPREHAKPDEQDSKQYNMWLGVHLQQINILQLMFSIDPCTLLRSRAITLDWLSRLYEAFNPRSHVQSPIVGRDLSLIPGARDEMHLMKHWVRDALYSIRRDFFTTVLRLMSLFSAFDKSSAVSCIKRAYGNLPDAGLPQDDHVMDNIVKLLNGTYRVSVSAGSKFLSHVVKSSQVVDFSVFCDCLEEVTGRISVLWQPPDLAQLNGLVLPQRLLLLSGDFTSKKGVPIAVIEAILDCVQDVLIRLQSNHTREAPVRSETDMPSKANLTSTLRDNFTSRICRALCFLTYNIRSPNIRQKIVSIFNALREAGPVQPAYRWYVEARRISEYLRAVIEHDSKGEDLVQLLHKGKDPQRVPPLRFPQITHIYFTNPSDIPSHLEMMHYKQCADAPVFEEIQAARKIQAAYRRYRQRCKAQTRAFGIGLVAQKNTVFAKCVKNVCSSNWRKTPYRTLYLWALPPLIVCLDFVKDIGREFKKTTKRQVSKKDYEHPGRDMDDINALLKKVHVLHERIEPNAIMHQKSHRDNAKMKQAVLDVRDIILHLPVKVPEIHDDFDLAYGLVIGFEEQHA